MSVQYSSVTMQLEAAVEAALARDLRGVADSDRCNELERMIELGEQLSTAIAHGVHVLDEEDTTLPSTGRSTWSWLVEEQHLNPREASRLRRLGRLLPAYPNVDEGLRTRRFSVAHAQVILRVLRTVPSEFTDIVEKCLLELAEQMTPKELEAEAEKLLVACGVESSSDAEQKRLTSRGLTIAPVLDGMRHIQGLVTPEVAEGLELIFGQLAQLAGVEDDRSQAQRQHDALGELINHYLSHGEMSDVNGERPRIVVTINWEALERDLRDAWGRLPSGAVIGPATARRLACDAEILPIVLGANSAVLDIANKTQRCFTHSVKRAAWNEQHGRCAFRGCRRKPVECHHITWWTHGGLSTLDNAAWLCAFHHWLVHDGGWTMRRDPERSFVFTSPTGQEFRRRIEAA